MPRKKSAEGEYIPSGFANNVKLQKSAPPNTHLKWNDVEIETTSTEVDLRL